MAKEQFLYKNQDIVIDYLDTFIENRCIALLGLRNSKTYFMFWVKVKVLKFVKVLKKITGPRGKRKKYITKDN